MSRSLMIASCFYLLATIQLSHGAAMSPEQVTIMAENWVARHAEAVGADVQALVLTPIVLGDAIPLFHWVDLGEQGWILVSSDDLLMPVIGWSNEARASEALPPALVDWLEAEQRAIRSLNSSATCQPASLAWQDLLATTGTTPADSLICETTGDVDPLIQARWHQGFGWNSVCPSDHGGPGGHVFVGCVGVAMGQVMDYWSWPPQGQSVQYYVHERYGPISVDFNHVTYDWNAIGANGISHGLRELLFHAGASVRTNYGPHSSTAQTPMVVPALITFFRYHNTARMVWRNSHTPENWSALLIAELTARRPVVYRGQGPSGGHAFNVDGVHDGRWFHINWGWGGAYDGNFLLEDLSPGNYSFSNLQGAVIGILPVEVPAALLSVSSCGENLVCLAWTPVIAATTYRIESRRSLDADWEDLQEVQGTVLQLSADEGVRLFRVIAIRETPALSDPDP